MTASQARQQARSKTPQRWPLEASSASASCSRPPRMAPTSPVKRAPGPTSRNVRTPERNRLSISATNSTGRASWSGQQVAGLVRIVGVRRRRGVGVNGRSVPAGTPPSPAPPGRPARRRRPGGCGTPPPRTAASPAPAARRTPSPPVQSRRPARTAPSAAARSCWPGPDRVSRRERTRGDDVCCGAWTASIAAGLAVGRRGRPSAGRAAATEGADPPGGCGRRRTGRSVRRSCGRRTASARTPNASSTRQAPRLTAPRAGWATSVRAGRLRWRPAPPA